MAKVKKVALVGTSFKKPKTCSYIKLILQNDLLKRVEQKKVAKIHDAE